MKMWVECLEARRLLDGAEDFSLHVNFQPAGSAVPAGYLADTGAVFADRGNGFSYGWDASAASATRDRNSPKSPDQRYDTMVHTQLYGTRTWEVALPNDQYDVHIVAGDPSFFGSVIKVNAEGLLIASGNQTSSSPFVEGEATVTVSDGRLTISNAPGASNNKLCFIDVTSANHNPPPPDSTLKINFQPAAAPVPPGYLVDSGATFAARGNGQSYGWSSNIAANARDRNNSALFIDQRFDTLEQFTTQKWELAVPSGTYSVRIVAGDPSYTDSNYKISAEGVVIIDGKPTSSEHWFDNSANVTVSDGRLTIASAAGYSNNKINFIEITPITIQPPPPQGNTITWTTGMSSPIPRSEAMTVTADNKMYVFGGYIDSGFTPIKRVDVYDPATNQWTRLADSDMPIGLTHSGCTLLGRDVIIAGGYPAKPGGNQTFSTTAVYDFNLDTHVWTTLPSLPAARGGGALVAVGNTLHYIGGSDSSRKDANSHWTFTPSAAGPGAEWATVAPLPTNRNHLGAVVLNGKIWVVGGQQNQDAAEIPQAALEVYDPATDSWTEKTPLPFGRSHIAAATLVVNGRIVTLGGEKTFNSVVANVSAYDPATDQWTEMTALPATRNSGVAAFINGELIYSTGRFATTTYRATIS